MKPNPIAIGFSVVGAAAFLALQSWAAVAFFALSLGAQVFVAYLDRNRSHDVEQMRAELNEARSQISSIIARINQEFL